MELDMRYYYGLIDWSSSDKGLETLLASSQLEKLYFIQEVLCSLPQKVPCCLLYKLKTIKITNFTDEKDCIGKAKNILTNGGALQKLTIRTGLYISEEEKLETYQVLLASPRKSKQCRILFI
ncbi:hypothetical protein E1A91_D01G083200v1 [Gossypium mustelinum]|uniref:FBD domain-containing protein n=3 Tax=Gossypium TaxID=3633 RepID=A0A5D2W4W6_GOSMU|nr:hypothetical protein E1A91_D01G083200v1 [Gossypium mustelinum]